MVGFSNATTCALLLHLVFLFYLPTPAVSLSFDYPTFSEADGNNIKIEGSASFSASSINIIGDSGSTDGDSYGRASYNATPVQLWDEVTGEVASFTTRFSFAFSGDSSGKGGMAFFLAGGYPSSLPYNCPDEIPVRVYCPAYKLGLTNQSTDAVASGDNRFVAVEFDIFNNTVVSDPHIGIDVNSLRSVKTEVLPSSSLISNLNAVIEYDSVSSNLTVALWLGDDADVPLGGKSYNLTYMLDLKSALPEQVSIGFSAAMSNSIPPLPPPLTNFDPMPTPNSISPLPPPLTNFDPMPTPSTDDGESQFNTRYIGLNSWYFNSWLEPRPAPPPAQPAAPSPAPPTPPGSGVIAGAAVGATMFLVLLFALAAALVVRRRRRKILDTDEDYKEDSTNSEDEGEPMTEIEMGTGPRRFPYHELVGATRNFAIQEKLGQGGFGAVYRGYLRELGGLAVAIKRLQSSMQGKKEYKSEIQVISRLRHRNLVQLIGWCHGHDQELLLVYELMPNRSLDIHLHGKQGTFLTWPMRMKILLELASALLYLHEEWEQCVIHRDIKPSNVMLDESFGAKLGDFGLARLVDHAAGMQTMTAISGTPGYLDPECVNTGRASAESDVYSFGVVLLEVACGRRPMSIIAPDQDKQKNGGVFRLVEWAWGLYGRGAFLEAADERLNGDYNAAEVERVMVVWLWCTHPNPSARPSIRTAMATLHPKVDQAYQLPVLPSKMPVPMYEPSPPLSWANVVGMSTSSSHTIGMSSSTSSGMPQHTSCTTTSDASTSTNSLKTSSSLLKDQ